MDEHPITSTGEFGHPLLSTNSAFLVSNKPQQTQKPEPKTPSQRQLLASNTLRSFDVCKRTMSGGGALLNPYTPNTNTPIITQEGMTALLEQMFDTALGNLGPQAARFGNNHNSGDTDSDDDDDDSENGSQYSYHSAR